MYRKNHLKNRLKAGQKCLGCWLFMGSPVVTEVLSLCGFDALIIDHEHAPGSLETANHQLRAASSTPTTMLVRLAANEPHFIRHALDAGAEGVIVANMESADQAEALVSASTFPTSGIRGVHRLSRAMDWGMAAEEYCSNVRENLLTVGLIESVKGVEAIPDICKIEGIDMLFLGAVDLSASIGKLGRIDDPEVMELITETERRTLEGGKWLGRVISPDHDPRLFFDRGYHFLTTASDIVLLKEAALKCVATMNR